MLTQALRRNWALALAVLLASMAATGLYAARLPTRYTATAVVALGPRPETAVSAGLVSLLATKYVSFAASEQGSQQLARQLGLEPADIASGLAVTMPDRTTNITVAVTLRDPTSAADVAAAVSDRIVERVASDPTLEADLVVPASATNVTEQTGRSRLLLAGAAASVLFAVVVVLLADAIRRVRATPPATPPDSVS
ncbi:MAG: hypothetical protein ACRDO1_02290 [Nocardioidaceae bacterium]